MEHGAVGRFRVDFAQAMSCRSEAEYRALVRRTRNSALPHRVMDVEQFGYLVEEWNALFPHERTRRRSYCLRTRHRWVKGPWPGTRVCTRCLEGNDGAE